jgi:anti-sigma factor RsiW
MNHDDMQEKLSAYMDDAVSTQERSAMEDHLAGCAECRKALEELRKTVAQLKNLEQVEPPTWLTQKIMAQVRSKAESRKSIWQKLFFPLHVKLPLEAVTALFCVVIGYYVYQSVEPTMKLAEAPVQNQRSMVVRQESAPAAPPPAQPASLPAKEQQSLTAEVREDVKDEMKVKAPAAKAEGKQRARGPAVGYREKEPVPAPPAHTAETTAPRKAMGLAEGERDVKARSRPGTKAAAGLADTLAMTDAVVSRVTVVVTNIEKASAEIRDKIGHSGGTVLKTDRVTNGFAIEATIPQARMEAFIDYLNKLGTIRDKNLPRVRADTPVSVRITITFEP